MGVKIGENAKKNGGWKCSRKNGLKSGRRNLRKMGKSLFEKAIDNVVKKWPIRCSNNRWKKTSR